MTAEPAVQSTLFKKASASWTQQGSRYACRACRAAPSRQGTRSARGTNSVLGPPSPNPRFPCPHSVDSAGNLSRPPQLAGRVPAARRECRQAELSARLQKANTGADKAITGIIYQSGKLSWQDSGRHAGRQKLWAPTTPLVNVQVPAANARHGAGVNPCN